MTKKRRKGGRFSSFAKLFIRNETPYPAALDGRVTPWIAISKQNKKAVAKSLKIVSKGIVPKILDKKTTEKKTAGLASLDIQLKKARLLLILKNGKPPRKTKETEPKNKSGAAQGRQIVMLRAEPKILKHSK